MKRSPEALVFLPMLVVIAAMAILGLCGIARAEPVQQFTFQIDSPRAGDLAAHMHLRRFDTTGLPCRRRRPTSRCGCRAGWRSNPAFLTARYLCDGPALRDALDAHILRRAVPAAAGAPRACLPARWSAAARSATWRRFRTCAHVRGDASAVAAGSSTRATPWRS